MSNFLTDLFDWFTDDVEQENVRAYRPNELHTFVVEKPFCAPARDIVLAALHPIGVPVLNMQEWIEKQAIGTLAKRMKIELKTFENLQYGPFAPGFLPMACRARFQVPIRRANQAEYWMLRTQRLVIVEGSVNAKNEAMANRHNGRMPRAADPQRGKAYAERKERNNSPNAKHDPNDSIQPTMESSCKQAQELWAQVEKLAKEHEKKKKRKQRGGWW